jgi:hypothetical protein
MKGRWVCFVAVLGLQNSISSLSCSSDDEEKMLVWSSTAENERLDIRCLTDHAAGPGSCEYQSG